MSYLYTICIIFSYYNYLYADFPPKSLLTTRFPLSALRSQLITSRPAFRPAKRRNPDNFLYKV